MPETATSTGEPVPAAPAMAGNVASRKGIARPRVMLDL